MIESLCCCAIAEWDLALQQIVPFIDGVNYVKRISIEADVEITIGTNDCQRDKTPILT